MKKILVQVVLASCLVVLATPLPAQNYGYKPDIGYTKLQTELGGALSTGAGQKVTQVEATLISGQKVYIPDPTQEPTDYAGKTINQKTAGGSVSSHATVVGQFFYGNVASVTPGINTVDVYETNDWLNSGFLKINTTSAPASPDTTSFNRIANHSWVGSFGTSAGSIALNLDALHRVDYIVEHDDFIQVVAINNPGGAQPLLAGSFNAIAVSYVNAGSSSAGTTNLDSLYVANRTKPDIVAPQDATSWATPIISSTAALLVQTAHNNTLVPGQGSYVSQRSSGLVIEHGESPEVIKALLMAGADRVANNSQTTYGSIIAGDYRSGGNATANGLDLRYGAGQVDVYNSYHILTAGEKNANAGSVAITKSGFDYNPAFANSATATYSFTGQTALTASLAWDAHVVGGAVFNGSTSLAHFILTLDKVGSAGHILSSLSTIDNTQNIYSTSLDPTATYTLNVSRTDALGAWDYGMAWMLTPVPEPSTWVLGLIGAALLVGAQRQTRLCRRAGFPDQAANS